MKKILSVLVVLATFSLSGVALTGCPGGSEGEGEGEGE